MNNEEYHDRNNRLLARLDDAEESGDVNHVHEIRELIRELNKDYLKGNDK